jgi:hypothetical protein
MSFSAEKTMEKVPGFLIGVGLAVPWFLGFGYLSRIFAYLPLFGGEVPRYYVLFYPSFSILPVSVIAFLFRKHNVVSGILVVAILFTTYAGLQTKKLADYSIARSGKPLPSALIEHFFNDNRSK